MSKQIEVSPERLKWLESLTLSEGSHDPEKEKAACVMEAVAYVAGEPWSDRPKCASRVITAFCVKLNDRWGNERRQALKPFVLRIAGTANGVESERKRAFMCADAAVREFLPCALEGRLPKWAAKLRALPEIVDTKTARASQLLAREARAAAYANADAAAYAADAAASAKGDALALALLDRLIRVTEASHV